MKFLKNIFLLGVIITLNLQCSPKIIQNTKSIKGTIGNKFHLSTTNFIEKNERRKFYKVVKPLENKVEKLDKYYSFQNLGKDIEAEEILKNDKVLSESTKLELAFSYSVIKMKKIGILYTPLIQCHNFEESHLISITEKDLISLDKYLNNKIEVQLKINKIGFMEMDKTNIYKLVEIEKTGNN